MTEESYILPQNLIEYEEFTQTEQSSHHNDDDCDDQARLEDPAAGSLLQLEEKYSVDGSYDQSERVLQHPSSTAQGARRDLTINVEDDQIGGHHHQPHHQQSNNTGQQRSRREGENDHNLFEQQQQLNTPRQTQLREGSSSSSKNNIGEGSASSRQDLKPPTNREEIFSSKIEHLQRIIGTQREHISMKEEKILFLLGQIATLNSTLAAKSAETSSIKRNFANIQQEMEQLKQQQKIKDQILNGESQILEMQIEQEEQIIYTLDKQLHHHNRSSRACSPAAAEEVDDSQRRPIAYSEQDHPQQQQQYHSHHHHETAGMIVDNSGSRSSKYNRKQIADMLNSQKAPAIVAPSTSNNGRNSHTAETAVQNDIRQYPPTTHNNAAPSHKFDSHEMKVYPASFSSGSCSGVCANSSQNKRSSSSHQHAASPPPLMSQTYINKIPRSDILEEESSTSTFSPASMKAPIALTASKHSAAGGSGGGYRDQYVKNIEELQTRLEILKKKRVEYDGKEKTWNKSVHSSAAAGAISSAGTATAGYMSGTSSSFHQYGASTRATNPGGSSSFSPKCNESSLLHFASIKKIESSNPHRESYFNKHLFSTATATSSPTAHVFTLGSEQPSSSGLTTANNNNSVKKHAANSKSPSTVPQYLGPFGIVSKKQSQSQQQFFPAESNSHHHHPLQRGDPFLFFDQKKKDNSSSSNNYSRVTRKSPVSALPAYKTPGSMSSSMISSNQLREASPTEIHSPSLIHLSSKQSSLFTSIRQKPKLHEEQQHHSFTNHQHIKASSLERHSPSRLQQIQQQILLHSNRHNDKSASKTKGQSSHYQQEQRIADHNSLSASLKKITDHKMSWESLIQRDSAHPLSFPHHSYISRNPNNSVTFQDTIPQDIHAVRLQPRRTSTFSISPRSPPLILTRNNDLQLSKMLPFS